MNEETFNYNQYVKKQLIEWKNNFEKDNNVVLNYTAIANTLKNNFNITTSTQKVAAIFNESTDREIKMQEIVAISQLFNIPLWDICHYPNNPEINTYDLIKNKSTDGQVKELSNQYYFTDEGQYYYCYYFKPQKSSNHIKSVEDSEIREAKMSISLKNGHTVLTFQEERANKTFFGDIMHSFTLSGKLYHYRNSDIAYSFVSDAEGRRAMSLMFKFLDLNSDIRYYMTLGMMTFSLDQIHEPLFQKMAAFRVRQDITDEKTAEIIRGILSLNSSPIIIDEATKKKLEEDDDMKKMLSEGQSKEIYYVYNEAILGNSFLIPDNNKRMELLLKLKKSSLCPANEIVSETDTFAKFIRQYQILQMQEQNPENNDK